MRPIAVINLIVFGSAAAISFGLCAVLAIFLVLRGQHPEFNEELVPLFRSSGLFLALAAVGGVSLRGMLQARRWRWLAFTGMWLTAACIVILYWPR
jgi:uncharacterized membrane protein